MGLLETKRVIQPPKRRRMTKRKRIILACAKAAGVVLAAFAVVIIIYMLAFAEYTYIDLSELTAATVTGYNGHGMLNTVTQTLAGQEEFFDTVSVNVLDTDEVKNGSLSNGDKIEIEYSYNKNYAKEHKLRVRGGSEFVTIKDLPEGTAISYDDLFAGAKLEYTGVAPLVTVSVSNVSTDTVLSGVEYIIEGEQQYYDEGDVVRVRAQFDEAKAIEAAYDIEQGPEGYVKDYTVSGVDRYLTDASELPQELLDQMKEYGATLFGKNEGDANEFGLRIFMSAGTMYSTSGGDYTFSWRTPVYISSYFTCLNEEHLGEPGQQVNDVKVVYDTGISQNDGKSVSAEAVVVFKDIIRKADGTITVNLDGGEIVSASTKDSDIKNMVKAKSDDNYTSTKLEQ